MTSTADVVQHHLESLAGGDLPGVISDYASDATLFTPNGTFNGTDEIQAFFEGFVASLPEDFIANMEVDVHSIDSEYGYITWHSGDAAPLGTDTFHVVDGKFAMQSFAAYLP
ncbi:nuclear transport factor 2 family protein [Candidatus Lucifugimonas marina]|jgi:ketosteroid isomerase-like protein|uniref:Nuclear transport factor 2 family protein n=1 Tax=Candidatus Lucifugimonas marina TaxID=3038979 RepID=A0AAJ5ZIU0_9CHLR|nr:nuclear transport factor 2 family protein [SAR202 cluster bacterium JH702]MDG0868334.1 nuclear transport factor 2 family protein [SAR202 cluster bacterium JH639]WFG34971.1 nuclear transport factor 2 family protein [SAR202 cluster bacterium JH545]WFG38928.1 nuclear transport factor 2 family protein [SAR202 cluster bacterium JH1073]